MPSVTAVKSLRVMPATGSGDIRIVGFGNPLLTGTDGTDRWAFEHKDQVDSAWAEEKKEWAEGCPLSSLAHASTGAIASHPG